jgi:hypothetical protein
MPCTALVRRYEGTRRARVSVCPQEGLGGWAGWGGFLGGGGGRAPPEPRSCHAYRGRPSQSCPGQPQAP